MNAAQHKAGAKMLRDLAGMERLFEMIMPMREKVADRLDELAAWHEQEGETKALATVDAVPAGLLDSAGPAVPACLCPGGLCPDCRARD